MNAFALALIGSLLILIGFIGCFLPAVPGPLIAYSSLWAAWLFGVDPGETRLWLGGAAVLVAAALDYLLPVILAKRFRCSRSGMLGCLLGTIAGLFFLPWGLVAGPVAGTMIGELTAGRTLFAAARGGLGAFLGFVVSLLVKLACTGLFARWFFASFGR